jgi:hypothetical protein
LGSGTVAVRSRASGGRIGPVTQKALGVGKDGPNLSARRRFEVGVVIVGLVVLVGFFVLLIYGFVVGAG